MAIIAPTLPENGQTIEAQDVNVPFNAILSLLNGGLDSDNLDSDATFEVSELKTDTIDEQSAAHGVSIDGMLAKDGYLVDVIPINQFYLGDLDEISPGTTYTSQAQTTATIDFAQLLRGATAAYFVGVGANGSDTQTGNINLYNSTDSAAISGAELGFTATTAAEDRSDDILAALPTESKAMVVQAKVTSGTISAYKIYLEVHY